MTMDTFSAEEIEALKGAFSIFDNERNETIKKENIPILLKNLGKNQEEINELIKNFESISNTNENDIITFNEFLELFHKCINKNDDFSLESDPKVLEFINILEEYRIKCEEEGNYLEAQRADTQLKALRKQEAKRKSKSLKAKQISERHDVQIAHNIQYSDFNHSWDQYMEEYDRMSKLYIKQMQEKHLNDLKLYQDKLYKEIIDKPPKYSKELIEWRRRQYRLAKQKDYNEAQKIKEIADNMEEKEKNKYNDDYKIIFQRKEIKFRQQQEIELQALLKRIDIRRKEHIKQRNLDSKRLLQRNRNVQAVLESKQAVECVRKLQDIKNSLIPKERTIKTGIQNSIPPEARVKKQSMKRNEEYLISNDLNSSINSSQSIIENDLNISS